MPATEYALKEYRQKSSVDRMVLLRPFHVHSARWLQCHFRPDHSITQNGGLFPPCICMWLGIQKFFFTTSRNNVLTKALFVPQFLHIMCSKDLVVWL